MVTEAEEAEQDQFSTSSSDDSLSELEETQRTTTVGGPSSDDLASESEVTEVPIEPSSSSSAPDSLPSALDQLFKDVEGNDEENELFREKRDADVTEESSVNNDGPEQETFLPDDFADFLRPTTPDPNYNEEFQAELFREAGVNITGGFVRGRSQCS